jgi:hypothetical protein
MFCPPCIILNGISKNALLINDRRRSKERDLSIDHIQARVGWKAKELNRELIQDASQILTNEVMARQLTVI